MKSGIIGLPQSGKTTVFDALTGTVGDPALKGENRIGTIQVPDNRIDVLSGMYEPAKTIYAQVEYFLPGARESRSDNGKGSNIWNLPAGNRGAGVWDGEEAQVIQSSFCQCACFCRYL